MPIAIQLRTSADVFKLLEEEIVYSKHAKGLKELENRDVAHVNLFDMKYVMNGKSK